MAKINDITLRNWNNGDTMNESDYEQERSIIVTAINDIQDQADNHRPRIETLETDNNGNKDKLTSLEDRTGSLETDVETIKLDVDGFDAAEVRTVKANTDLFYLHNSNYMKPVTFQDLKDKQITYGSLKYGMVRFYAFKFFRYPDGGEM